MSWDSGDPLAACGISIVEENVDQRWVEFTQRERLSSSVETRYFRERVRFARILPHRWPGLADRLNNAQLDRIKQHHVEELRRDGLCRGDAGDPRVLAPALFSRPTAARRP